MDSAVGGSPGRTQASGRTRAGDEGSRLGASSKGGRLLVSRNCLDRSLTLYRVLSRADARPTLVLGARRGETSVAGHAWIEIDGESPFDSEIHGYTPVVALTGRPSESAHPTV